MKLILLFVVASLTLVGAMVAITVPNVVEAAKKPQNWCFPIQITGLPPIDRCGFESHKDCTISQDADAAAIEGEKCFKSKT